MITSDMESQNLLHELETLSLRLEWSEQERLRIAQKLADSMSECDDLHNRLQTYNQINRIFDAMKKLVEVQGVLYPHQIPDTVAGLQTHRPRRSLLSRLLNVKGSTDWKTRAIVAETRLANYPEPDLQFELRAAQQEVRVGQMRNEELISRVSEKEMTLHILQFKVNRIRGLEATISQRDDKIAELESELQNKFSEVSRLEVKNEQFLRQLESMLAQQTHIDGHKTANAELQKELETTKNARSVTEAKLEILKIAHSVTQEELASTKNAHSNTQKELASTKHLNSLTQKELAATISNHSNTQTELALTKHLNSLTQKELAATISNHSAIQKELETTKNTLRYTSNNLSLARTKHITDGTRISQLERDTTAATSSLYETTHALRTIKGNSTEAKLEFLKTALSERDGVYKTLEVTTCLGAHLTIGNLKVAQLDSEVLRKAIGDFEDHAAVREIKRLKRADVELVKVVSCLDDVPGKDIVAKIDGLKMGYDERGGG